MLKKIFLLLLLLPLVACKLQSDASSQSPKVILNHGDFSPFKETLNNKINSHAFVSNPDGSDEIVEYFYIDGTACRGEDCKYGSVRSSVDSNIWDDMRPKSVTSPQQAWYSFEIFFPMDTPIHPIAEQSTIILVEFKESNECASFVFAKNDNNNSLSELNFFLAEYTGSVRRLVGAPEECLSYFEAKISDIKPLLGRWVRFEYFVRWSQHNDGYIIIFQDGKKVLERIGRTCHSTAQCLQRNIHYYGLYQSDNPNLAGINTTEAYYRNVSMAQERENLVR